MASRAPGKGGKTASVTTSANGAIDTVGEAVTAPVQAIASTVEQITETLAASTAPINEEVQVMNETMKQAANETANRATAAFGEVNERAQAAADKGAKLFEEFNDFARGNIEALVESSRIAAKGAEDIAKYTADYGRKALEQGNENAKRLASVKSPTELFQLQSEMMKGAVDSMVSEASKFTENYLKLVGDVVQPISNRVSVAAEKVKVAA